MEKLIRKPLKAGTWYPKGDSLNSLIKSTLEISKTQIDTSKSIKALIGPHAGYRYCSKYLASGYKNILSNKNTKNVENVFILGPSHKYGFDGCAVSVADICKTSIGELKVNTEIVKDILNSKCDLFQQIKLDREEKEHSLELHFPYILKSFNKNIKIVPIMISRINLLEAQNIAKVLYKYFKNRKNFFVISSDFCHWGKRFRYTYFEKLSYTNIHESIEAIDKLGCNVIQKLSPKMWVDYFQKYRNTICGRRPILVLLSLFEMFEEKTKISCKLCDYGQSSQCKTMNDSSVSYATLIFHFQ